MDPLLRRVPGFNSGVKVDCKWSELMKIIQNALRECEAPDTFTHRANRREALTLSGPPVPSCGEGLPGQAWSTAARGLAAGPWGLCSAIGTADPSDENGSQCPGLGFVPLWLGGRGAPDSLGQC